MTRIENAFIRSHFQADFIEEIGGGWATINAAVVNARKVLADPVKFPNADVAYLEKLDLEGTCCLLQAPVQFLA